MVVIAGFSILRQCDQIYYIIAIKCKTNMYVINRMNFYMIYFVTPHKMHDCFTCSCD